MTDFQKSVPFAVPQTVVRPKPADLDASGFEIAGAKVGGFEIFQPQSKEAPSPQTKARVADLFLRGALTAEQYRDAVQTQGGFERIVGRNNLLPAAFLEVGVQTSRATCLVKTSGIDFDGQRGSWVGTGFLVSRNLLLTNHHVINSLDVARAGECVFNFQLGVDGRPGQTKSFRMRPDRLFLTSPAVGGLDFTLVWVDGDPGNEFGNVRIDRNSFSSGINEFANVVGHPQGRMKEVSLQENNVLWMDDTVVHYTSDTEGGNSGSAVSNNSWNVFALHHAAKPTHVEGHDFLNEGIKFSAISAHLERLAQSTGAEARQAQEARAVFGGVTESAGFFGTLGRRAKDGAQGDLEAVVSTFDGTDQDIDVGFWNVEWLTNRYADKVPDVAQVIHAMKLDIWSLEESSPNAAKALVQELNSTYGLNYDWLAAEPDSADGKQSCTIIWNKATVSCETMEWEEPIETWLQVRSTDFDELGLEAVHGKVFDRYPRLFFVKSMGDGASIDFHLVPLHLKAMSEGSLRRAMASKILAAAVKKKIESGSDADWILGGDFNAELASNDFDSLLTNGMVSVSAADESGGAFSYVKSPFKSLIDHIFLSPNLAEKYGATDFFIVAAEQTFPDYIEKISDHRPVVLRMSRGGNLEASTTPMPESARTHELRELKQLLGLGVQSQDKEETAGYESDNAGFERRRRPAPGRGHGGLSRTGYATDFLGGGDFEVPFPLLSPSQLTDAVAVSSTASGLRKHILDYTHFSVVMNGARRMPFYSICNIDGTQSRNIPRGDDWRSDPRISADFQCGNDIYRNNDLDRGHMTRRLDPVWGSLDIASRANNETFYFTNACPQHKDLNQREWLELEDYVLGNANTLDLRVSVATGPVFGTNDRPYRGIEIPLAFWKLVVMRRTDTGRLSATGYILTQEDMISGLEFVFGPFKTYQVSLTTISARTGLDFGRLSNFDPMTSGRDGFEAGPAPSKLIRGVEDLRL